MADSFASNGARAAASPVPSPSLFENAVSTPHMARHLAIASSGIDPIQLHTQAMNALGRITRELLAPETDYELVNSQLARASEALGTLRIVDAHFTN